MTSVKPPAIVKADDGNKKAIPIMNVDHGFKSYARQGVLSALLSKLDPKFCKVHTGRRLKYHANLRHGGVMLMFESEKPDNVRSCDILIAADGVHSSIRQEMYEHFPQYTKSIFSGQYAYRMIFSAEALRAKDPNNAALNGFILVGPVSLTAIPKLSNYDYDSDFINSGAGRISTSRPSSSAQKSI